MKRAKMAAALLIAVGMALCLAGCAARTHAGPSGLSEISYADSEKYMPGPAELTEAVEHIDIHWPVGSVTVKPHGAEAVSLSEESARELADDARLRYWLDGTTLHIQFCKAGEWLLDEMEKDLTVLVPEGRTLKEVEVNSLSAEVCLDGLQADRLTLGTTSGEMRLADCDVTDLVSVSAISAQVSLDGLQAGRLEVGTTSGDMRLMDCAVTESVSVSTISGALEAEFAQPLNAFSGDSTSGAFQISAPAIESFSSSAISGPMRLTVEEAPRALDIQTTSGDIDLALPEDAAFTLDYEATSGELSSDLPYTTEGGRHIFGDGTGAYAIGAISGDLRITMRK